MKLKNYVVTLFALTGLLAGITAAQSIKPGDPARPSTVAIQPASAKLVRRGADPGGSPRPAPDARNVPLRTSLYFELEPSATQGTKLDPDALAVDLQPDGGNAAALLQPGREFEHGAFGWVRNQGEKSLAIYIEPAIALQPQTRYSVRVSTIAAGKRTDGGSWSFTTDPAPSVHRIDYRLDLASKPVQWHGHFFSGICNVIFCSQAENYGPTYELMAQARQQHPLAWSLQRDFWLTGFDFRSPGPFFPSNLPNIVRERETRRITSMRPQKDAMVLHIEDFFGHEQYGIASNRPVSADYHPGDEVLIADGINNARTKVIAADDSARTVTVAAFTTPEGGWKIDYDGALPTRQNPDAPGLFPPGGCYLRKYNPSGTACYYWGRLDKEWDLAVRRYGRRVLPNFADAPGDLSRDGKSWTTVKDYAKWHEVARTIAGHVIDRYGPRSLEFTWSIFNEPDLWILFWHGTWDELQTHYDYTTDAILRAFEDRGYDSNKVFIGGLELGAVFGTNLKLTEFLAHCSPRAQAQGALPLNAAFADHRLDGKRSRRVESLCRAHGGKGAPCDFVSIHSYNYSDMMASKLAKAKETALEIDPEYYKSLWIDSHECCPGWIPPPDTAAADAYLGDGYFPAWCMDVVHRQLLRAQEDPRYSYGETILTVWPPPTNFAALNAVSRNVRVQADATHPASTVTIAMPIFHAVNLLSDLGLGGEKYWVLPSRTIGGNGVGGFASQDSKGTIRVLLYAHEAQDMQSRSDDTFEVALDLSAPGWNTAAKVTEYRIDRVNNSPFPQVKKLLAEQAASQPKTNDSAVAAYPAKAVERIREASECRPTTESTCRPSPDGHLHLTARVCGNGCNFLVVTQPAG